MAVQVAVLCGVEKLGREMALALACEGLVVDAQPDVYLLVDAPWGWATSSRVPVALEEAVIVTDNPCPEYRLDLLDERPAALLGNASISDIVRTLSHWQTDELPCLKNRSLLTSAERAVLRLAAKGLRTKKMAKQRGISEGRVKNILGAIYYKLGLNGQTELSLYYYGCWHVLYERGWEPPRSTRDF
jgi:DNA-binding CsgD family transcriptional regulator